ncbi:MAG: hypothetical protein JXR05_17085 [Flavobacteriaceae bacterium]
MQNSEIKDLELMAVGDVAKYLKVSNGRFHALIKKYNIPHKDTSAGKIFLKSDIVKFQKDREVNMKHSRSDKK